MIPGFGLGNTWQGVITKLPHLPTNSKNNWFSKFLPKMPVNAQSANNFSMNEQTLKNVNPESWQSDLTCPFYQISRFSSNTCLFRHHDTIILTSPPEIRTQSKTLTPTGNAIELINQRVISVALIRNESAKIGVENGDPRDRIFFSL